MKTKPLLKWLGLAATSTALSLAPVYAAPEKEAAKAETNAEKRAESKAERVEKRVENQADRADDKAERVEKRVEKQTERRTENPSEKRAAKQSEKRAEDQAEQRAENQAERRADNQAERRADNMAEKREENQAERQAEKRADRIEDRQEDRADRREIKQRFEARERDRIVGYFSQHEGRQHGLPPELAAKWQSGKRLPSGWRDRVVSGYIIEESWMPSFHPVPYSWFPDIAVTPDTRLYWYGDRVVRVYEPRREVVDVVIIPSIHIDL